MELVTTGEVVVSAKIEVLADIHSAERGHLPAEKIRSLDVSDAVVDTGATLLSMPKRLIAQLGLGLRRKRRVRMVSGTFEVRVYDSVRLTVQGRDCTIEVGELPYDCPVLIGQVPLLSMDWVVDPVNQRLIGNPEHNGEWMWDCF